MNIYQYMDENPIITILIVWILCTTIFRTCNRFFRHLNIRSKGWPPSHLDADGDADWTKTEEEES